MAHINQDLKEIAKILEIDVPLSTYVARHTYAIVLKKGGADISKIKQALGHTDITRSRTIDKSSKQRRKSYSTFVRWSIGLCL